MKNLIGCNKTNYNLFNLLMLMRGLRNPIAQSITPLPFGPIRNGMFHRLRDAFNSYTPSARSQ
jgi:hypothetical protein